MKHRCQLCGGRILGDRCSDCGMDYSRRKADYCLNESRSPEKVGTEKKKSSSNVEEWHKVVSQKVEKQVRPSGSFSKKPVKTKGNAGMILAIAFTLLSGFLSLGNVFDEVSVPDITFEEQEIDIEPEDEIVLPNDTYSEIGRLPESPGEGEIWHLLPGEYIVGEDIPEGCYMVNTAGEYGTANIRVKDHENGLYLDRFIVAPEGTGERPGTYQLHNLRLYEGACLMIDGDTALEFTVESAYLGDEL